MPHKALALQALFLLLLNYYQKEKRAQNFRPEEQMKLRNSLKVAGKVKMAIKRWHAGEKETEIQSSRMRDRNRQ